MLSLDVLTFTTQSLVIYLYHLITDVLPPTPDMLLLEICPCYDITYYLPPVMLTLNLWLSHLRESCTCYPVSYTM